MFIESIELLNYRNYKQLHIDFHEGTNVLYGDNAQGKTNILESVYVCSTTKSTGEVRTEKSCSSGRRNPILR